MSPPFEPLLSRATLRVHGHDANKALFEARSALVDKYGKATYYEMVLAPDLTWPGFMRQYLSKLLTYLGDKKDTIPGGPHVMIAVWQGEHVHIFDGRSFWNAVSEIEGCTIAQIPSRTREPAPVLLIGPGPGDKSGS